MNTAKSTAAVLFAITILSGSAAASPLQMNIFPNEGTTRIDSYTSFTLTLKNSGTTLDRYDLSSNSRDEITIAPDRISLEPGEKRDITVFYDPSQDKSEGLYEYKISAQSEATTTYYDIRLPVRVITDHEVSVNYSQRKVTRCIENGSLDTSFIVENEGIQRETFSLDTNTGEIGQQRLTLEEGETQQVKLTLPADKPSNREVRLEARSTRSYAQTSETFEYRVEDCFDINVSQTTDQVAAGPNSNINLKVTNTGTRDAVYTVSTESETVEGPTEISIDSGETEMITFTTNTEQLGKKSLTVRLSGPASFERTVNYRVTNKMQSKVQLPDEARVCQERSERLNYSVRNTGQSQESFSLKTSRGSLSNTSTGTLQPGETFEGSLSLPEGFKTGKRNVKITSTASTYGRPSDSDTTRLKVENCFDGEISVIPSAQGAGDNRSALYRVRLKNTGSRTASFELSHDGPRWITLKPDSLTVKPGMSATSNMYAGIPSTVSEERFKISATAESVNVELSETVSLTQGESDGKESRRGSLISGSFNLDGVGSPVAIIVSIVSGLVISTALLKP